MTRHDAAILGGISLKLSRPGDYFQKLGRTGGRPKKSRQQPKATAPQTRNYNELLKLCSEELNGGGK